MQQRLPFAILGVGSAVPAKVLTNADFEKFLETSDEWIRTRTGIQERRICQNGENTLSLAETASRKALDDAGLDPKDIDLIILATCTPYVPLPATACYLQARLGCRHVPAFDIAAACSGFVYALASAACLMHCAPYKYALVIGTEAMSAVTDFADRSTCVLLGDGAGAAILGPAKDQNTGIYEYHLGADGQGAEAIYIPAGGSGQPANAATVNDRRHYLRMRGREIYKFAVLKMQEVIQQAVDNAGIQIDDLALVIPHQSNARIIESAAERLQLPMERVLINIDKYGNTSAASIPLGLDEAIREKRVKKGDWILLAGFGGGLTWGSVLFRL
jgi:3-oxoacyl-[acyl-carrier-protein] synthase-3